MRQQGRLTEWNDERGFGFIAPLAGGDVVFTHVSQFPRALRRPIVTDLVTYDVSRDERGRLRAQDVEFLAPTRARNQVPGYVSEPAPAGSAAGVALVSLGLLGVLGVFLRVAWVILAVDVLLSAVSIAAYHSDKQAAQQGGWRTQESALHLLALMGGWPGALLAQRLFRHKTRKQSFQVVFWLTVVGNVLVLVWLLFTSAQTAILG